MSGVKLAKRKKRTEICNIIAEVLHDTRNHSQKTPFLQCLAPPPYVGIFLCGFFFCLCKITSRSSLHHHAQS